MKSNKTIVYLTKKYYFARLVLNLKSSILTTCSLFLAFGVFAQNGVGVNTLVPKSSFDDVGSFGKKVTNITATTTLSEIHSTVVCDNTSDITVTLPAASSCARRIYEIKRSSVSTNLVTISGTIDGVANYLLSYPNQSITIFSDSTKWLSRDGSVDNNAWKLTGNKGTVAGTNFIGTTDAIDWVVKTNGIERGRFKSDAAGSFGIGTTTPFTYGKLAIVSDNLGVGREDDLGIASFNGSPSPSLLFFSSQGTEASPTTVLNGNSLFTIIGKGTLGTDPNTTMTTISSTYKGDGTNRKSDLGFSTTNAQRMIIDENGFVGIGTLTPKSLTQINGSFAKKVTITAASLTLNETHSTIVCENVGVNITLTLPAAASVRGRIYDIKKNSTSTGTVTLSGGGNIDGAASLVLTGKNTAATVFSDSTEWKTMQGGSALNGTAWALKGNSETDTTIHFIGPTDGPGLIFKVGSTKRMKILSDGKVHVGNLAPQQRFSVDGGITLDMGEKNNGTTAEPCLKFGYNSGAAIGSNRFVNTANLNYQGLDFYATGKIMMSILGINNGDIVREGNVGINTLAPTARLHVIGQIQGNPTNRNAVANYAGTLLENIATANFAGITKKGVEIKSTGTWTGSGGAASTNIGLHVSSVLGGDINYDAIFNGGGDVGIGTNTPNARLEVEKNANNKNILSVQNTNAAGYSSIDYFNETDTLSFTTGYGNSGSGFPKLAYISTYRKDFIITHLGSTTHDFYIKGTTPGSGLANVGIGTNAPQQNLSVQNGMNIDQIGANAGTITNTLRFGSNSGSGIGSDRNGGTNSNGLDFYTNSLNRMAISNTGSVGIGINAPEEVLHLYKTGVAPAGPAVLLESNGGGTKIMSYKIRTWDGMAANAYVGYGAVDDGAGSSRAAIYAPNGAGVIEAVSILKTTGNVGINTTAPTSNLSVNGTADKVGGGTWGTFSDKRLKKDIVDYSDGLDKLMKIHAVKFKYNGKGPYNDTSTEYIGVIAQEIKEVVPYTVSTYKMKLNPEDKEDTELLKFDGSSLQYMLINSVKELKYEVDALKKEIETLKAAQK